MSSSITAFSSPRANHYPIMLFFFLLIFFFSFFGVVVVVVVVVVHVHVVLLLLLILGWLSPTALHVYIFFSHTRYAVPVSTGRWRARRLQEKPIVRAGSIVRQLRLIPENEEIWSIWHKNNVCHEWRAIYGRHVPTFPSGTSIIAIIFSDFSTTLVSIDQVRDNSEANLWTSWYLRTWSCIKEPSLELTSNLWGSNSISSWPWIGFLLPLLLLLLLLLLFFLLLLLKWICERILRISVLCIR